MYKIEGGGVQKSFSIIDPNWAETEFNKEWDVDQPVLFSTGSSWTILVPYIFFSLKNTHNIRMHILSTNSSVA